MTGISQWVARAAMVLSALVVSAGASAQVTWSVADGKVTGAQNVLVGGSFYDVTFGDTYIPAADFVSLAFSRLAAQALVDQVFVIGAPLSLDDAPSVLQGCTGQGVCRAMTLYGTESFAQGNPVNVFIWGFSAAHNYEKGSFADRTEFSPHMPTALPRLDTSWSDTYASWSVTAVPEPETYAMMLAGLGLIGTIARRRKAKQA
jgi:hypothetical protein